MQKILSSIVELIHSKPVFRVALSGGSTPIPLYALLSQQPIDWSRVEIFQVDERYVPSDHVQSNQNMLSKTLLSKIAPKKITFFDTTKAISESVRDYEQCIQNVHFDLVLLGIGSDGHTASLFPGSVISEQALVAHTTTHEFPVEDRLTLTYTALEKADHIFFLISGSEKKAIVDRLPPNAPAKRLLALPQSRLFYTE